MRVKRLLTIAVLLAVPSSSALASDGLNSGDTAWIIVSTALVMMMTPAGLALFYGNPKQLWLQIVSIAATAAFTAAGTLIVTYITKFISGGLRVKEES
jgi:Amt family ammonium transporter